MILPTYRISKNLIIINILVTILYLSWWFDPSHAGNHFLYLLLLTGEIYHVVMALTFWETVYPFSQKKQLFFNNYSKPFTPSVDIFIPTAGEPVEVVKKTALAAKNLFYNNHRVYILNDGFVARKNNWMDIEIMAQDIGVSCLTRKIGGGAKAGNINGGLKQTGGDIIVLLDADMVPHQDFLQKTVPYFQNPKTGFVQTPQYYQNFETNDVTKGAWEQQSLFFGAIMEGKGRQDSAFICGTNVALRRRALEEVGGFVEDNIAEDFLTSFYLHRKGWQSIYLNEVLVEGLAPEDLLSYHKQQQRWARGSLEILFSHNPLFTGNLTWRQKIQYLSSALYYLNGLVVLIDMLMPLVFLFTGLEPVSAATTSFALYFIPFMLLNMYTLYLASGQSFTFRAISFSQSSFTIQLSALKSLLFKEKMGFSVTPKEAQKGNYLYLSYYHLSYIIIALLGFITSINRRGFTPSTITNIAWTVFNIFVFFPFLKAAFPVYKTREEKPVFKNQPEIVVSA